MEEMAGIESISNQIEVTIVILEFEEFENDLPRTIQSILDVLPKIHVLVVSQRRPYPPVHFPKGNLWLVIRAGSFVGPKQSAYNIYLYICTHRFSIMYSYYRHNRSKTRLRSLALGRGGEGRGKWSERESGGRGEGTASFNVLATTIHFRACKIELS